MPDLVAADARVRTVMARAAGTLRSAGVETASLDARILTGHVLGCDPAGLVRRCEDLLDAGAQARIERLAARRARGEPSAYITGTKEFWRFAFQVTPDVLVPRPDSELLVEAGLRALADVRAPRILDLGTGSGCLLISLLMERGDATGIGADRSAAALELARANARAAGVSDRMGLVCGDWGASLNATFDLVLSNPPYISAAELSAAPKELGFEPEVALLGGDDGLGAYRALAGQVPDLLARDGVALFEIGSGQKAPVERLMCDAGFARVTTHLDLGGRPRMIKAQFSGDR